MAQLAPIPAVKPVDRQPLVVPLGLTQPDILDVVTNDDGSPIDMTGSTVLFFMRPLLSRTPLTDGGTAYAISPADSNGHNVGYRWGTSDTAVEGEYMAWWGYVAPGSSLAETPEFPIIVSDHGPGLGASTGVIVDGVAQFMPVSYDALRSDSRYGDRFLQRQADRVKRVVLGVAVSPDAEATYDPILVDYLSKKTALSLIAPASEYWARQHRTATIQNPTEIESFPDMGKELEGLATRLRCELPNDWRQVQLLVPGLPQLHVMAAPKSTAHHHFNTPNPAHTQRPALGGPRWGIFMP